MLCENDNLGVNSARTWLLLQKEKIIMKKVSAYVLENAAICV